LKELKEKERRLEEGKTGEKERGRSLAKGEGETPQRERERENPLEEREREGGSKRRRKREASKREREREREREGETTVEEGEEKKTRRERRRKRRLKAREERKKKDLLEENSPSFFPLKNLLPASLALLANGISSSLCSIIGGVDDKRILHNVRPCSRVCRRMEMGIAPASAPEPSWRANMTPRSTSPPTSSSSLCLVL